MNVLSLFDGISCAQIALERLGVKVDNYYSSEIDLWCMKVTQANYPNTIHLGDIENWRNWDIDYSTIDLVIGGSPCQGFSFAGKLLAFDDPRSKLFFDFAELLNHVKSINPDVRFLLENVRMQKQHLDVITEYLGVQPMAINSSLLSAQSRPRLYWFNWDAPIPKEKGISLARILQKPNEIDEKYLHTQVAIDYMNTKTSNGKDKWARASHSDVKNIKSACVCASFAKGVPNNVLIAYNESGEKVIRKFTPIEIERLQTVPDGYTDHVSDFQRYHMLGNAFTVDVIVHILSYIPNISEKILK